jgi:hypothetical protein
MVVSDSVVILGFALMIRCSTRIDMSGPCVFDAGSKPEDIETAIAIGVHEFYRFRQFNPIKLKNEPVLRRMFTVIAKAVSGLNEGEGFIYHNLLNGSEYPGRMIEYRMGSPAPWLIKFAPQGHGLNDFTLCERYRDVEPEPGLMAGLRGLHQTGGFTRYSPQTCREHFEPGYILFTMQGLGKAPFCERSGEDLANEAIAWANENRRRIVIRWHPTSDDTLTPETWWRSRERGLYTSLSVTSPINTLIAQCSQLWTLSSATGLEALLYAKPVSLFGDADYAVCAHSARCAETAFHTQPRLSMQDMERFLTWYCRHLCIDIRDDGCIERLRERITRYFIAGCDTQDFYG